MPTVALMLCTAGWTGPSTPPTPVATAELSKLFNFDISKNIPTLAFASNDSIAVGVCQPYPSTKCELQVLHFSDGQIRSIAKVGNFWHGWNIHRAHDGQLLISATLPQEDGILYSPDLTNKQPLSFDRTSISGETVGKFLGDDRWGFQRIYPHGTKLTEVSTGRLISISDSAMLIQDGKAVHVRSLDGGAQGEFTVKSKDPAFGQILDGRVYLDSPPRIVDFSGHTLIRLSRPPGWAVRWGWNGNGTRIVYDTYDRKRTFLQKLSDLIPDDNAPANEEYIRIVDTHTAGICFDLVQPLNENSEGDVHADISPSGSYAAVVTASSLNIYRLPASCDSKANLPH